MTIPTRKDRLLARQVPVNKIKVMHQDWRNLLFLHWVIDPVIIQSTLPPGLYTDTFNNTAFIGITPFHLQNLQLGFLPSIPGISHFPEVNVRTYVYNEDGIPGVWFYTLYADKYLAVEAAKLINLPYRYADIEIHTDTGINMVSFNVKAIHESNNNISSLFKYKLEADEFYADSESLEFFLTERYYLFTYSPDTKKLSKIQVHHQPYPLCNTQLLSADTNLLLNNNFDVTGRAPDHIISSPGVDVDIYQLETNK